ncbi:hypothetical protein U8607_17670 [Methylobacterium durans]|uniref:hypothetical protein n=1 Tax=Methylobacterium durans TaxID=2202825 RepID=UPI002AFE9EE4|nr:hypothetical protein [Methylobacterium durans]MEA1833919.1 hypothetical protein [Methylobacterium durans]
MRTHLALATAVCLALAGAATAQGRLDSSRAGTAEPVRSGAIPSTGNTDPDLGPTTNLPGNPSNASVPGTNPGVNIGGTPTGGPPGTGGTAGGPGIGNR